MDHWEAVWCGVVRGGVLVVVVAGEWEWAGRLGTDRNFETSF